MTIFVRGTKARLAPLALLILLMLLLPMAGRSATGSSDFGPKVDPSLAAVASSASSTTQLHAIVYGSNLEAANAALGSTLTVRQPLGQIGGESVTIAAGALPQLTAEAGVDYVTLDRDIVLTGDVRPELNGNSLVTQYPVVDGAVSVWKRGYTGSKVGVAVIDSGTTKMVDFSNDDRIKQEKLKGQQDGRLNDPYGHGTFVAGVVGGFALDGHFIGVAPRAKITALNVSRPDGVRTSDVMAALLWVLANHRGKNIDVVNLSLTETTPSSYLTNPLDTVVERLWRDGVVVVASAGNKGPGTTSYAPANDPFVITVGATDTHGTVDTSDDTVATFSSTGPTLDGIAKPNILAPGRRIASILPAGTVLDGQAPASARLQPGYAQMSGTSFSAPQVAGAAALLLEANPNLTPDQIKALLASTAVPVTDSAVGTLDVAAALAAPVPSVTEAAQPYTEASWGATPRITPAAPLPLPDTPPPPVVNVAQPTPPNPGTPKFSYPNLNDPLCSKCTSARTAETYAAGLPASTAPSTLANAWEKAASAWEPAPSWERAASAWLKAANAWSEAGSQDKVLNDAKKSAVDYERAAAWDKFAGWDDAAGAWEIVAAAYEQASAWDKAADAWESAMDDHAGAGNSAGLAAAAWNGAANWEKIAAAQDAAAKLNPSGDAWHKAALSWDLAAAGRALAGQNDLNAAAWNAAGVDYDAAAKLYTSGGKTSKALADQNAAALRYDGAGVAWYKAAAWNQSQAAYAAAGAEWRQLAKASEQNANDLQNVANQTKTAGDYAKAAQAWDAVAAISRNAATVSELAAAAWNAAAWNAAAWNAAAWNNAAAAFDRAADDWKTSADYSKKSTDIWTKAGDAQGLAAALATRTAATVSEAANEERSGDAYTTAGNFSAAGSQYSNAAKDYLTAAAWNAAAWNAAAWNNSAKAWEKCAAAWNQLSSWDKTGQAWEMAAAAWNSNGSWESAAAAWDNAANAWSNALKLDHSAADLNRAGSAWARAGQWDKAVFDWSLAASRDPGVDWATPDVASSAWQGAAGAWFDAFAWD